jgi:hypothetical protein
MQKRVRLFFAILGSLVIIFSYQNCAEKIAVEEDGSQETHLNTQKNGEGKFETIMEVPVSFLTEGGFIYIVFEGEIGVDYSNSEISGFGMYNGELAGNFTSPLLNGYCEEDTKAGSQECSAMFEVPPLYTAEHRFEAHKPKAEIYVYDYNIIEGKYEISNY